MSTNRRTSYHPVLLHKTERWRRIFEHHGFSCVSMAFDLGAGISKMVWCREPLEKMDLAEPGQHCIFNPLFHANFTDDATEETARELIQAKFDGYWNDVEELQSDPNNVVVLRRVRVVLFCRLLVDCEMAEPE